MPVLTDRRLRKRAIASLVAGVVLAGIFVAVAGSTDAGPANPSVGADAAGIGTVTWLNPTQVTSSNDSYATASLNPTNTTSHYLKASGYGFAIATGSTITGVTVSVERAATGTADLRDASVKLLDASGVVAGTEHADTATSYTHGVDGTASYGGTSDLWGLALTPAIVNDPDFGVAFAAKYVAGATNNGARVDVITVTVSYTSGGGTPPSNTTPPGISGSATVGSTLTRVQGVWSGTTPITYAYQWRSCDSAGANCANITGATSTSYTVASSDLGKTIRVVETATNSAGSGTATSAQTAVVTTSGGGTPPSNTTPPGISGSATVGSTLTRVQGVWSGTTPITYAYQWRSCDSAGANCANITGATSTSYTVASSDLGKTIRVVETATNSAGSGTATSAQTAVVTNGAPTSWTATNYSRSIFLDPSGIPYTAWTGLWKNPADASLWMAFTESSGTQGAGTPAWVETRLGYTVNPARDHWDLTNITAYYKSVDQGTTWTVAKPNNGVDDAMRTWNPAVSSCVDSSSTGSNCPTIHPIPFTPQANIALNDGTIIRRVNGEDIGFDQLVKKTAFIQRLAPGAGQTWGAPEYLLDPTTCNCTYQISRIRRLADGRLIALGQKWDGYDPRGTTAHLLLMVGDSTAHNWVTALTSQPELFSENEWDVAELPNGDLLATFRTADNCSTACNRRQGLLRKSGSTWSLAAADVKTPPFTHSGHPELLATSSGAVLYIATTDTSGQRGIWYLSNSNAQANSTAWTKLPISIPAGGSTIDCVVVAGTTYNCSSRYYPRSIEDCSGGTCTIVIFSHSGSDDDYWEVNGHTGITQVNEYIVKQKFVLTSP